MMTLARTALLLGSLTATSAFAQLGVAELPVSPAQTVETRPLYDLGADHAAERVRQETGGRVLDVRPVADDPSSAYEVRILLDEGRVRRIRVDSDSGTAR